MSDIQPTDQTPTADVTVEPHAHPETSTPEPPVTEGKGYPENTPLAEMTTEQQLAYWKAQSRKHEDTAKARADYDAIRQERDSLRQANQTDAERAIETARAEARAEALAEAGVNVIGALVRARLGERAEAVLSGMNSAAFLADDGSVDDDRLSAYLSAIAPTAPTARDPHQGARTKAPGMSGVERGRAEAARRFNKSTS